MRALIAALMLLASPALADPVTITDMRGPQTFASPPQKIAALDWSVTEALLDLGLTPAGVAEPAAYADWVVNPPLPPGAVDLGLRAEPNLEALAALHPDVIITADIDPALVPVLEQIAPVVVFQAFDANQDNAAAAQQIFLSLGTLTGTRALAEQKLAAQEATLDAIAKRLAEHFGAALPKVTSIRLNDATSAYVNGSNSMPEYVLKRLGFSNELPQPNSRWGITLVKAQDLAAAKTGIVLTIGPDMGGVGLRQTPIWAFLPFVKAGRLADVAPVWSYGGALSITRLAQGFEAALLTIPVAALAQ
ncbi:iron-hydroxamate ABC transporter substrate-binding protein [Cypionkella aquatica]|uniref:Iron-hydroxamate ABC transporter substrate-binding protein n=1 Tax=Cypionkella aquatica TaxID=1756042 RepID=A0AA37TQV7_9RHOB|nr:iron-siderophore ABC transporter substrate-binding protein [Cypionkella aquatica]GLS85957.1 iron-hydroxamate ABC transporter substrate-binding protein [Cypionkella aquatica]